MIMAKKSTCPITRTQFRTKAQPVKVVIGTEQVREFLIPIKEFSTGSLGWYLNEKISVTIDGVPVQVQVGLNMTIIGSKELPADPAAAPTPPTDEEAA
jgi:hypothetical protein